MKKRGSLWVLLCLCVALLASCATSGEPLAQTFGVVSNRISTKSEDDPLRIWYLKPSSPNSAGGVDVDAMFTNQSDKMIKYLRVTVVPYNAVMDPVHCHVRGRSSVTLEDVGPWVPNGTDIGGWENVWYNSTISYLSLERVEIEYMDGTKITLP